ncbi:diguanylate cyclase [Novispirillum itersonii]|uniref:diguanylate cyclase n=1 Tax=Novispirillum itersonii TaxID=189 RepID=UPI00037F8B07|nr:diguanylate cyclase [Novispirillum itersonii]
MTLPTVLIVDDEPHIIDIASGVLSADYDLLFALNGDRAIELATGQSPDLILLDVTMPGRDGFDVCRALKQHPDTASIPVIFVTGRIDPEDETRGLEIGAVDYVSKPITPAILRARVRNHLELKQIRDHLARLAMRDGLTGLFNRRHLDQTLQQECERVGRGGKDLSLLMIDVDHFKRYNDSMGHQAGDDCLRHVGAALQRPLHRKTDLAARYGGEEFVAVLPATSAGEAFRMAEAIRLSVWDAALPHPDSPFGRVSLSVGVATVSGGTRVTPDGLLGRADAALYRAKAEGRNRSVAA